MGIKARWWTRKASVGVIGIFPLANVRSPCSICGALTHSHTPLNLRVSASPVYVDDVLCLIFSMHLVQEYLLDRSLVLMLLCFLLLLLTYVLVYLFSKRVSATHSGRFSAPPLLAYAVITCDVVWMYLHMLGVLMY
jgi:hypothetical protein